MAPFELQLVDGGVIVVLRFQGSDAMNAMLDPISNRVDGPIKNRMGHNFPRDEMTPTELQRVLPKHVQKPCRYVIACVKGNAQVGVGEGANLLHVILGKYDCVETVTT
jgi:hypothetical protein